MSDPFKQTIRCLQGNDQLVKVVKIKSRVCDPTWSSFDVRCSPDSAHLLARTAIVTRPSFFLLIFFGTSLSSSSCPSSSFSIVDLVKFLLVLLLALGLKVKSLLSEYVSPSSTLVSYMTFIQTRPWSLRILRIYQTLISQVVPLVT